MKDNLSLVLTKPEGTGFLDTARVELPHVGKVVLEKSVTITEEMLRVMYPNDTDEERSVNHPHMLGKTCVVFVLEGQNIVNDLFVFVGKDRNPEMCDPRSLRYRVWNSGFFPLPVLMPSNKEYYFNGFHRVKTAEEFHLQAPIILNGSYDVLVNTQ
ncbi:MAG: hypothetical protein PHG25_00270 [Candidatus Pacebacteria bacterium]|nr:hypothetical protein [Candidatus Paceibacterota bacterium]